MLPCWSPVLQVGQLFFFFNSNLLADTLEYISAVIPEAKREV